MKDLRSTLFVGVFTIAFVGAVPGKVSAGTRYQHASSCQVVSGTATFNSAGQYANTGGVSILLWCPLITDPLATFPGTAPAITASAFLNGNGNPMSLFVCSVFAGGGGQNCTQLSVGAGLVGVVQLHPDVPAVVGGDSVYMTVRLGPNSAGSSNTFFGYSLN